MRFTIVILAAFVIIQASSMPFQSESTDLNQYESQEDQKSLNTLESLERVKRGCCKFISKR